MSATPVDDNSKQNSLESKTPEPIKQESWGRSFFRVDSCTLFFATALIIGGVALFILNALYAYDFYIAAVASISTGSALFLLGLLTRCCSGLSSISSNALLENLDSTETAKADSDPIVPLAMEKPTREYFESKGIFGLPDDLIEEIDIWRAYRTSESWDISMNAGFLLYGPPGTGKTTIAMAIAELLGGTYHEKPCGGFKSGLHGGTEKKITEQFTVPENEFRVVVIDEISGLLPERSVSTELTSQTTEHFLSTVNGTQNTKPRFILIGTTNHLELLDPAVVRSGRLGKQFFIDNPDLEARKMIFQHALNKLQLDPAENWSTFAQTLAKQTPRFSCASIAQGVIVEAQKRAALAKRALKQDDFLTSIENHA